MSRIRIKKTNRNKIKQESITKSRYSAAGLKALAQLDAYINRASPELITFLAGKFRSMENVIAYEDLREAFMSGELTEAKMEDWRQAYSAIITETILPAWREAMDQAALDQADLIEFKWDNFSDRIKLFTQQRTADLVTVVTDGQKDAIAALTERVTTGEFTAPELAKAIRPTVGLNLPQQRANLNYYETMKAQYEETMSKAAAETKAREAALKYAEKQHRYRAKMIAETEIAMAYKTGVQEAMHQARDQGVIELNTKTWVTAGNELVCPECGKLNGVTIQVDRQFHIGGYVVQVDNELAMEGGRVAEMDGHAHPNCKCACTYNY